MNDPHRTLVATATHGDRPAIEELLDRHLPALRAYVRLRASPLIRAQESCSDLVQSVCCEVLEKLPEFEYRGEPQFRSWLFKMAMSKIIERSRYLTKQKRDVRRLAPFDEAEVAGAESGGAAGRRFCLSTADTPSKIVIGEETMRRLESAFDSLTEAQREVFLLSRLVGIENAEIAATLGKSQTAVRSLLHRALVRLGRVAFVDGPRRSSVV